MTQEARYLRVVGERLREVIGGPLVGVYAGGSYALGDYLPGRSDLDVAAVVRPALGHEAADALVADLRHDSFRVRRAGWSLSCTGLRPLGPEARNRTSSSTSTPPRARR